MLKRFAKIVEDGKHSSKKATKIMIWAANEKAS